MTQEGGRLLAIDEPRVRVVLRLLSGVTAALGEAIGHVSSLQRVVELLVPEACDGAAIELEDHGIRGLVAHAGAFPAGRRGGEAHLLELAIGSAEQPLGWLRVARRGPPFDGADLETFRLIAQHVAFALEHARRYGREHALAQTLQRALLPGALPAGSAQRFDAAYRASAEEAIVGGDWYDAFPLPDGRIAISIGDVAGHGLPAALIMAEVRQGVRAAALDPKTPALVLERANRIVNMRVNPAMVTAIFGILDPATSTLTYACAGHPPPILALADGAAVLLPGGGVPLGIGDAVDAIDWIFTLPPGSLLACYTDGMTECGRDVIAGENALMELVCREIVEPSRSPARSLLERTFEGRRNIDDAAVLTVGVDDAIGDDFTFLFSAIPFAAPLARRALRRYAERTGLDEAETYALLAVVGEAVANAIEHAYPGERGTVGVRVGRTGGSLEIVVEDRGRWKAAQKRDERGRGVPLMRALAKTVEIRTDNVRTVVRMRLDLGGAATG